MANFAGTSGDDSILGTSQPDTFHLEDGGDDSAIGGGGADLFIMGASLTADDQLDGGGGHDEVFLDGDYSEGLVLGRNTLHAIEYLLLAGGFSYDLSGFAGPSVGGAFTVDARSLGESDSARIDVSGVKLGCLLQGGLGADALTGGRGADTIDGGGGADTLSGGEGNDRLELQQGPVTALGGAGDDEIVADAAILPEARIDGGEGSDFLLVTGRSEGLLQLQDTTLAGIEWIALQNFLAFDLVMADGNVASGVSLRVTTAATGKDLSFDGSAETDGTFDITGAERGHNNLTGGAGDDTISGADHADTLIGGAGDDILNGLSGADKLVGGLGSDTMSGGVGQDRFFYLSAEDSSAAAPDLIEKFGQNDILYLRPVDADTTKVGNQTFHLVEAFSGHAGELTVGFDRSLHVTVISGDVDGDGLADLVIYLDSKHPDGLVL